MKTRTLARCTAPWTPCDWHAEGPDADRQAAKHTKTTGHATTCEAWPERAEKDDEREKP